MAKLFLELVSPEKKLISEEVDEVYAPGEEGDFGILPDHVSFVSALRSGELHYRVGDTIEYVAIDGGFLKVSDNKVDILADDAELGKDINLELVLQRKAEAERELDAARKADSEMMDAAEIKLKKELLRLNVANRYR